MAPLKSFLLASSGLAASLTCTQDNCEAGDQTALLQSHLTRKSDMALTGTGAAFFPKLGNLHDPLTRKSALLEIQKTAVKLSSMDQSEVTDVVVEVCTDTANMLNYTVLQAIYAEHQVDERRLEEGLAAFDEIDSPVSEGELSDQLAAALALLQQRSDALTSCRTTQSQQCLEYEECEVDVHPPCEGCQNCDNCDIADSLCSLDYEIHTRWCTGDYQNAALRTATTTTGIEWRTETKTIFQRYQVAVDECQAVCHNCTEITDTCETIHIIVDETSIECNSFHHDWLAAKCAYHRVGQFDMQMYQEAYMRALVDYNDIIAHVMISEADRKVEWEVVTRVICLLLTLTNTEDGSAASAENTAMIQACYDLPVDTTHLDIEYLPPPDMVTIPDIGPLPCAADTVHDDIYGVPPVCDIAITNGHMTAATAVCPCLDLVAPTSPTLELGHYLLVDPSITITIPTGQAQWQSVIGDVTYVGPISALHTESMPALTSGFFTEDEITDLDAANGGIASVAFAYGSPSYVANGADGLPLPMNIEQRFARNGGMIYMDSAGAVIAIRELASSRSPLAQDATAYMSFEPARTLTEAEFTSSCSGGGLDVTDGWQIHLGAEKYCWNQGSLAGDGWTCTAGCFVYKMAYGYVAFPRIA